MLKKAGFFQPFFLKVFFMELQKLYSYFKESTGVTTDSRNCNPGSLFFALRGERFNGNEYALQALSEGCLLAVVDDEILDGIPGCFYVPDVLKALQQLATMHRQASGARFVGITGSNGKTTTKELMASVLSEKYNVWYTRGNLNNHIGVPLTLLSMPPQTEVAVIEMGANHIGEIALLSAIAQPDLGLITNVGKAHLEGFGSFEGVKKAKGELYDFLKSHKRQVFINVDNNHLTEMLGSWPKIGYGTREGELVTGRQAIAEPFLGFEWKTDGSDWHMAKTNLTGLYNFENALAAVCVGTYFEVPPHLIAKALESYEPVNNRSQLTQTTRNQVLMDAYNANPSSMGAALINFSRMEGRDKALILGGMKELGHDSVAEHQALVNNILEMDFNHCLLVGPEFKELVPDDRRFAWFESVAQLIQHLRETGLSHHLILVKGSRSNQLEKVLEAL